MVNKRVRRGDILCMYEHEDADFTTYYIFINALPNGLYNLVEIDSEGSAVQLVQLRKELFNVPHSLPLALQSLID